MRPQAEPVIHIGDERFKVTEWQFSVGAETGWHVHGHDYVIVPLTDGTLGLEEPGGARREAALTQGIPYSRRRGVAHNVINAGKAPMAFLEVEVVDDALHEQRAAVLEHFFAAWNARDIDALMACMSEHCAFHTAAGPDAEGERHEGRAAVQAAFGTIFDTFPKAAWTEVRHQVIGDVGLSSWRFIGTNTTGRTADVRGCDIFSFQGDRIALKDSYRKMRNAE